MVVNQALELVERHLDSADTQIAAIRGALLCGAAYTAARRGDAGTAWRRWDAAHDVATRMPASYYHPVTSFSRAVMGAHAVTIAVELRSGREAVRQARATVGVIPSRPRQARHEIEVARAYHLAGDPVPPCRGSRGGARHVGGGVHTGAGDDPLQRLRQTDPPGGDGDAARGGTAAGRRASRKGRHGVATRILDELSGVGWFLELERIDLLARFMDH